MRRSYSSSDQSAMCRCPWRPGRSGAHGDLHEEKKMTRSLKVLTAAALCSLWALTPVAAVEQFSGPCAEMVSRFCKDVTPGGGRVMKCLSEHQDAQNAGCRDWLADQNKSLKDL